MCKFLDRISAHCNIGNASNLRLKESQVNETFTKNTKLVANVDIATADESISSATDFFDELNGVGAVLKTNCTACHSDSGAAIFSGIPLLFCSDEMAAETIYRSILSRVNTENPTDSLLLRKPTEGATSLGADLLDTQIAGYHGGGSVLTSSQIATLVNWINAGANPDSATGSIPGDFFSCSSTTN